jgi:inner membrane protein
LSPVAHLQYGWWFAHWVDINRRERAAIALAGAGPDLDGLSLFGGGDAYYRYHHILFHNAGASLAVIPLAGIFFWRRPLVWLLVVFAFSMHMVEDYFTVSWNMYPWEPFNATVVNLSNHIPGWIVQDVFQTAAILFILGMTIWIYLRYHRTPLEIISPAFDRLIVGYAVLPWRNRCAECTHRAHFRCAQCGRLVCAEHGIVRRGFRVECKQCPKLPQTV